MASVATYTKSGAKASKKTTLDKNVFGGDVLNHDLIRQAYLATAAEARQGAPAVKTRGKVRGGGRKPWRQKGTGNARAGSIRSPIWRGGGITFGPTGRENYSKKINASAKRRALLQALSLKAKDGSIAVIDDLQTENGKTSELKQLLNKLDLGHSVTIVVDKKTDNLVRSAANIPNVDVKTANYLNVKTVIDADMLLITTAGLDSLQARLGGKK